MVNCFKRLLLLEVVSSIKALISNLKEKTLDLLVSSQGIDLNGLFSTQLVTFTG